MPLHCFFISVLFIDFIHTQHKHKQLQRGGYYFYRIIYNIVIKILQCRSLFVKLLQLFPIFYWTHILSNLSYKNKTKFLDQQYSLHYIKPLSNLVCTCLSGSVCMCACKVCTYNQVTQLLFVETSQPTFKTRLFLPPFILNPLWSSTTLRYD